MSPHKEIEPWGEITYWKDGVACTRNEEWDNVRFTVLLAKMFGPTYAVNFGRDHISVAGTVRLMLAHAVECGKTERSNEIARLLGVRQDDNPRSIAVLAVR